MSSRAKSPNHDGEALRPTAAANRGDDGHEGSEDGQRLDSALESADDPGHAEREREVHQDPRQAILQRLNNRRVDRLGDSGSDHGGYVLGGLLLHRLHRLVDGDNAE